MRVQSGETNSSLEYYAKGKAVPSLDMSKAVTMSTVSCKSPEDAACQLSAEATLPHRSKAVGAERLRQMLMSWKYNKLPANNAG